MAISMTAEVLEFERYGSRFRSGGTGNLGTYAAGGLAVTPGQLGLSVIDKLFFFSAGTGYSFKYVPSTGKVKAYAATSEVPSPLVVEEAKVVASNVTTLTQLPAYIVAIHVTAGGVTGAFNVIPVGSTVATKEAAVNFLTGVLTFFATDAVTAAKVTYIPQSAGGVFAASNMVIDELVTASASKTNLAFRAAAVQYIYDTTDSVLNSPEPPAEQPTSTHLSTLDINDAGNSSIDSHADDATNILKVTYLKYSGLPSTTGFIDDTDVTLVSQAYNFTALGGYTGLVIPGRGTQLVGEEVAAGDEIASWEGPTGTAANGVAVWNPTINAITTANTNAIVTTAISWLLLPYAIADGVANEIPAGTDLSSATFDWRAWGV